MGYDSRLNDPEDDEQKDEQGDPRKDERKDEASSHRYEAPSRSSVGELMREDRKAAGLNQLEAADALGFSQSKLSAYELGKIRHPPAERLVAMAKLYGRPDNFYLNMLGWSDGAKLVNQIPPEGALVIEEPRAGLSEFIDLVNQCTDPDFALLIDMARTLTSETLENESYASGLRRILAAMVRES